MPYTGEGFQASESTHRVKWMESPSSHFVGGEEEGGGVGVGVGVEEEDDEGGHRSENEDDSRATYESGVRVHSAKRFRSQSARVYPRESFGSVGGSSALCTTVV